MRDVTHLIWPESAFPFFLTREPDALAQIADAAAAGHGADHRRGARAGDRARRGSSKRAYNSVYVIDHDGSILSVYDKVHLVPFGEYLPFQDAAREPRPACSSPRCRAASSPATGAARMDVPRAPRFLPLICYEIIFPGEARAARRAAGLAAQPHQ